MTVEPNMNGRGNGLAEQAPDSNQTILVAGGAGYIGCVLIPKLVERGYKVRLLDRMYFGEQGLDGVRERMDLGPVGQLLGQVGPELAVAARDQNALQAHRTVPKRSMRGCSSCISSSQRML